MTSYIRILLLPNNYPWFIYWILSFSLFGMCEHPLALAESGWVWVGAGSRPAGLRTGRAIPGLRRDAALPVRQKTRQGREGGRPP
jgi:hypothetical protein